MNSKQKEAGLVIPISVQINFKIRSINKNWEFSKW